MKIGIIAAMSDEREQLSKLLDGLREEQVGLFRYVIGELGGNTLYIMECGIGISNIFRLVSVDSIWRLTYRNTPNATLWGVRFRFDLDF